MQGNIWFPIPKYVGELNTTSTLTLEIALYESGHQRTQISKMSNNRKISELVLNLHLTVLILCFSHVLCYFLSVYFWCRDSLNSFQHFVSQCLFLHVHSIIHTCGIPVEYTHIFLSVWHVYCIYNTHFYLKLGLQLKYIHAHLEFFTGN